MADTPITRKLANQWGGQVSNASPHLVPDGAMQSQINVANVEPGVFGVRKGHAPISFANAETGVTGASGTIISQTFFRRPHADFVVYQLANGSLVVGRTPDA